MRFCIYIHYIIIQNIALDKWTIYNRTGIEVFTMQEFERKNKELKNTEKDLMIICALILFRT